MSSPETGRTSPHESLGDASQAAERAHRRRLPPDVRRGQIVETAAAFFAEVGLEGRTRDLSARLGITQSLLYKYFDSKESLLEAVFEHVYLGRLSPDWPGLLTDRSMPLRDRMIRFYEGYSKAIFTYEWMRIFISSGLAGEQLNRRYLSHVNELLLTPMLAEIKQATRGPREPDMEDIWSLHGGIVYIGIRKFIYQVPTPELAEAQIARSIDMFLEYFDAQSSR